MPVLLRGGQRLAARPVRAPRVRDLLGPDRLQRCPICHRRIARQPVPAPAPPREPSGSARSRCSTSDRRRRGRRARIQTLLAPARTSPLGRGSRRPGGARGHAASRAFPTDRRQGDDGARLRPLARVRRSREHLRTATDVLRALFVSMGGRRPPARPADAVAPPAAAPVLLEALDGIRRTARRGHAPARRALEAVGEAAPVESTPLPEHGAGVRRDPPHARRRRCTSGGPDGHVRARAPRTWATQIEEALVPGSWSSRWRSPPSAGRAGPPLRPPPAGGRGPGAAIAALRDAAPRVPAPLLLTPLASIRARTRRWRARLLPARGGHARVPPPTRAPAARPRASSTRSSRLIHGELLTRAARLARPTSALLDEQPARPDRPVPRAPRRPRARRRPARQHLPIPDGDPLRLFVHWTETADAARRPRPLRLALRRRLAVQGLVRLHRPRGRRRRRQALRRPDVRARPAGRLRVHRPRPRGCARPASATSW